MTSQELAKCLHCTNKTIIKKIRLINPHAEYIITPEQGEIYEIDDKTAHEIASTFPKLTKICRLNLIRFIKNKEDPIQKLTKNRLKNTFYF